MSEEKMEIIRTPELENLVKVQNRLASSLIDFARSHDLAKGKDWVQGGWTRASDKIDLGWRIAGALQE